MTLVVRPGYLWDTDALNYIDRVNVADAAAGQPGGLESGVADAIDAFVKGCKSDGIWYAIRASCILAGARTLSGALVPLVKQSGDSSPASFGTAGGWNYNRKTGLQGNGTDNYINSGRNNNADPQNSRHLSIFVSTSATRDVNKGLIGAGIADSGSSGIVSAVTNDRLVFRQSSSGSLESASSETAPTFIGTTRTTASLMTYRFNAVSVSGQGSDVSQTPLSQNVIVFGRNLTAQANARLAFYSIGESLDLALLDTRVTDLVNAIGAAIP